MENERYTSIFFLNVEILSGHKQCKEFIHSSGEIWLTSLPDQNVSEGLDRTNCKSTNQSVVIKKMMNNWSHFKLLTSQALETTAIYQGSIGKPSNGISVSIPNG